MSSLHYTYLGPVLSMSYDKVEYKDWMGTEQGSVDMTGTTYGGGIALQIFVENFCGDFQFKYVRSDLDFSIDLGEILLQGKYLWKINDIFSAGAGLGLYSEIPLSEPDHKGSAGIQLPVSAVITGSPMWKVFLDIYCRYGSFGMGEGSSRIALGSNLGVVFRVGRI
jgi:hypothetical protein